MKTKVENLYNSNSTLQGSYKKPLVCPYCGAYCNPSFKNYSSIPFNASTIYCIMFYADCCDKLFFSLNQLPSNTKEMDLILVYPPAMPIALPDNIKSMSPGFVKLYGQAAFAEQNAHFELSGAGYRNAIEVLIKDFAIHHCAKPVEEVNSKSLNQAIAEYLPSINAKVSADVLRQLGNGYTHYNNVHNEIDFSTFKKYVEIFIRAVELELLVASPVVPTNYQQTTQS